MIVRDGAVVLLRNERDEWELPGGRLEAGEQPHECVVREIAEELSLAVDVVAEVDTWLYEVEPGRNVNILTFGCSEQSAAAAVLSDEHSELRWFRLDEVPALVMPEGYKRSIAAWVKMSGSE